MHIFQCVHVRLQSTRMTKQIKINQAKLFIVNVISLVFVCICHDQILAGQASEINSPSLIFHG